jgi:hypothetical protein
MRIISMLPISVPVVAVIGSLRRDGHVNLLSLIRKGLI